MPRRLWLSWAVVALLAFLCAVLAIVQNRWIYELSVAERDRLHLALQTDLNRVARDFDATLAADCAALTPSFGDVLQLGSEVACKRQYQHWKDSHDAVFRRIGLAKWEDSKPSLYLLDLEGETFARAEWPAAWGGMRERIERRGSEFDTHSPPPPLPQTGLLQISLMGSMHREPHEEEGHGPFEMFRRESGGQEQGGQGPPNEDHLILELNADYLRSTLLPDVLAKDLSVSNGSAFDVKIVTETQPALAVLNIGSAVVHPEATVGLLDAGRLEAPRNRRGGPLRERGLGQGPLSASQTQWRLLVQHHGPSMDASVTSARRRNIALSGGILLLIISMAVISLRFSRRTEQLAALQMNFVAGVSHELRTPLTVIRTAAYNLRGRVATRPEQVEKYGQLIQSESEKLSILVDQVLRYGAASLGQVIGERRPVEVGQLIASTIDASSAASRQQDLNLVTQVDPDLPLILADELAMKHALQNLVENAVKYGLEGGNWIGISAKSVPDGTGAAVEIRIADGGPGIPAEEQLHLFDAFFRGRRAIDDQIHGTGLGLNLVKSIVEAHGGSICVNSGPARGAEFVIRIPSAPEEVQNVFANTVG